MSQILVELQEWMGTDRSIAEAAWTSSKELQEKELKTDEDVERLVHRLAYDGHSVPFESVVLRFWYYLPIQTDRQHMTHRIASHSGMSGRYRTMPDEWLKLPLDVIDILTKLPESEASKIMERYEELCSQSNEFYNVTLLSLKNARDNLKIISNNEYKRCREVIRGVLPQNNMTERVSIFNLRSFCNYYRLRSSNSAQVEIQELADGMLREIKAKNIAPTALKALEMNDWII